MPHGLCVLSRSSSSEQPLKIIVHILLSDVNLMLKPICSKPRLPSSMLYSPGSVSVRRGGCRLCTLIFTTTSAAPLTSHSHPYYLKGDVSEAR
jgi:hypothetical protein